MPDPTNRARPGTANRDAYLSGLLKADLRSEVDLLDAELLAAREAEAQLKTELEALRAARPNEGRGVAMVLHFGGSPLSNTQRELIRCGATGALADSWMVRIGDRLFTQAGQPIPVRPYLNLPPSLQSKVRHTRADAEAALLKLARRGR